MHVDDGNIDGLPDQLGRSAAADDDVDPFSLRLLGDGNPFLQISDPDLKVQILLFRTARLDQVFHGCIWSYKQGFYSHLIPHLYSFKIVVQS